MFSLLEAVSEELRFGLFIFILLQKSTALPCTNKHFAVVFCGDLCLSSPGGFQSVITVISFVKKFGQVPARALISKRTTGLSPMNLTRLDPHQIVTKSQQ